MLRGLLCGDVVADDLVWLGVFGGSWAGDDPSKVGLRGIGLMIFARYDLSWDE